MASSTPISSSRGAGGSTSPRQSLSEILDLDPSCQNFTCIGYASSNHNNRCRRQIRAMDRDLAKVLLTTGDDDLESDEDLEQLLSRIAPRVLCAGYHRDQAPTIVAEWSRLVAAYKDNSHNSPASNERASAIRALPSARNNLSRYARVEPDIPPHVTQPRHPQREDKEPQPHESTSRLSRSTPRRERQVQSPGPVSNPYSNILETSPSAHSGSPSQPGDIERNHRAHYRVSRFGDSASPTRTTTRRVRTADREEGSTQVTRGASYVLHDSAGPLPAAPILVSTSPRTSTRTAGRVETSRTRSTSSRARTSGPISRLAGQSRPTTTSRSTTNSGTPAVLQPRRSTQEIVDSQPPVIPAPPSFSPFEQYFHPPSTTAVTDILGLATPSAYSPYYLPPIPKQLAVRRPTTGDCSICYEPLATAPLSWNGEKQKKEHRFRRHRHSDKDKDKDPLVWCRSECGINFHKSCLDCWKNCCPRLSCPNW